MAQQDNRFLLTPKEFDAAFSKPSWSLTCCSALFSAIAAFSEYGRRNIDVAQTLAIIGEELADHQMETLDKAHGEILSRYLRGDPGGE